MHSLRNSRSLSASESAGVTTRWDLLTKWPSKTYVLRYLLNVNTSQQCWGRGLDAKLSMLTDWTIIPTIIIQPHYSLHESKRCSSGTDPGPTFVLQSKQMILYLLWLTEISTSTLFPVVVTYRLFNFLLRSYNFLSGALQHRPWQPLRCPMQV